jgi:hypothetical protein
MPAVETGHIATMAISTLKYPLQFKKYEKQDQKGRKDGSHRMQSPHEPNSLFILADSKLLKHYTVCLYGSKGQYII